MMKEKAKTEAQEKNSSVALRNDSGPEQRFAGSPQIPWPVSRTKTQCDYGYLTQFGLRFSLKAAMPSRASSDSRACM